MTVKKKVSGSKVKGISDYEIKLRDQFAVAALQGLLASGKYPEDMEEFTDSVWDLAYQMMEDRKQIFST